jgi:glucose-1-phosphate adenylyltransferase
MREQRSHTGMAMPVNREQSVTPHSRHAMAIVLAGWRGDRLMELTSNRAKAALYFGAKLRIIDFALSNALNSGIRRIAVATQYKAHSLIRHLQRGWTFLRRERNESFDILPASQRLAETLWYRGTADAVFQNEDIIRSYAPEYLVIAAGDHVYKMDYEPMLREHVANDADVTIACMTMPNRIASRYGVLECDSDDRVRRFQESPGAALTSEDGAVSQTSIGIYVFRTQFLLERLRAEAGRSGDTFDFGRDIISRLVRDARVFAHPFGRSCVRTRPDAALYWRDLDTLDEYFDANIALTDTVPDLDLYDRTWPLWTYSEMMAPTKFVHEEHDRRGEAVASVVAGGVIISGSRVRRSLLFSYVHVHSYAVVERAVILPEADIGRAVRLRNVIVDRGVRIPEGLVVGEDAELDARRFRRTEAGVCLITQAMVDELA